MNIDPEIFDAYKCPTPEQAMTMIPIMGAAMVGALYKGGDEELAALRKKYYAEADKHAPDGSKARLFANMIWNMAEEKARAAKAIFRCRHCHQKNRCLLTRSGICGACKQPLYSDDIVEA